MRCFLAAYYYLFRENKTCPSKKQVSMKLLLKSIKCYTDGVKNKNLFFHWSKTILWLIKKVVFFISQKNIFDLFFFNMSKSLSVQNYTFSKTTLTSLRKKFAPFLGTVCFPQVFIIIKTRFLMPHAKNMINPNKGLSINYVDTTLAKIKGTPPRGRS